MNKILVIGSEGFIGSNAVVYFKDKGFEVHEADIVLKEADNYSRLNETIPDFNQLFNENSFDVCINASGAANVQYSFQEPSIDYTLNTANVFSLLNAIRQSNPTCKFINTSSAAVYGNPLYASIDEVHPINPLSPYGLHKYYSEQICKEFYDYFNIKTISLRVFSAYGPGLKKQLFWDLYQKSLSNDEALIYGSGNESRDFIYIDDIMYAFECVIKNATFDGGVINVANGEEIFIKDAVSVFYYLLNKKNYRFTGTTKLGDPINWKADINSLQRLDYRSHVDLKEGLKRYVKWLKERE